jgi:hypothetical protein
MTTIEYLDRPPTGWFVLDVMRCQARKRDWVALMIDIDPDCPDWRDGSRRARNAFVRVPGKHRNKDAAWDAFQDLVATRH